MTNKNAGLSWPRWMSIAFLGTVLPVAAWLRSLTGPVDLPVLADVVTSIFYVILLVCLGVALVLSLPRSR